MINYHVLKVYHAVDPTTRFLERLSVLGDCYIPFDDSQPKYFAEDVRNYDDRSLIIFAGHGFSEGLYSPANIRYGTEDYLMMDANLANICFQDHDVILLACRSEQFIKKLSTYNNILGFGNIISSQEELNVYNFNNKVPITMSDEDINVFNIAFTNAFCKVVSLVNNKKITFLQIPDFIHYMVNKEIIMIQKNKSIENRQEISRQLFRFRNEMLLLKSNR